MSSKTPYRDGAKIYAHGTWMALFAIILSGFSIYEKSLVNLSITDSSLYAFAASVSFAYIMSCHHNSRLLVKQLIQKEVFGGRYALAAIIWVLMNALALGYFFLLRDDIIQSVLLLIVSGTSLTVFSYLYRKHFQAQFLAIYQAEQLDIAEKRLVKAYKTYSGFKRPNNEDKNLYDEAINTQNIRTISNARYFYELKIIALQHKNRAY